MPIILIKECPDGSAHIVADTNRLTLNSETELIGQTRLTLEAGLWAQIKSVILEEA